MSKQSEFFDKMRPYAAEASSATGVPVAVILAQWANESAYGTSDLARNANNYGGIKWVAASIASGKYGSYASYAGPSQFVEDYIRVLSLPHYDKVRAAHDIPAAVRVLGESPYAESHYGGQGQNLQSIIDGYGLDKAYPVGTAAGEMSAEEFKTYAAIGVAAVGLFALIKAVK